MKNFDSSRPMQSSSREIGMEAFRTRTVKYGGQRPSSGFSASASAQHGRDLKHAGCRRPFPSATNDDSKHISVAFIGNDLKEQFFPNVDAVGKTIAINGRPFEVIGVAKTLGAVFGQSRDNFVMIPAQTYFKMFGARQGLGYNALALDQSRLA